MSSQLFAIDDHNKILWVVKSGDYEASDRPKPVSKKNVCIPGKAMAVALHHRLMSYFLWHILKGIVFQNETIDLPVIRAQMLEYIMADKLSIGDITNFEKLGVYFKKRPVCVQLYESFIEMTSKYHYLGMDLLTFFYQIR